MRERSLYFKGNKIAVGFNEVKFKKTSFVNLSLEMKSKFLSKKNLRLIDLKVKEYFYHFWKYALYLKLTKISPHNESFKVFFVSLSALF